MFTSYAVMIMGAIMFFPYASLLHKSAFFMTLCEWSWLHIIIIMISVSRGVARAWCWCSGCVSADLDSHCMYVNSLLVHYCDLYPLYMDEAGCFSEPPLSVQGLATAISALLVNNGARWLFTLGARASTAEQGCQLKEGCVGYVHCISVNLPWLH